MKDELKPSGRSGGRNRVAALKDGSPAEGQKISKTSGGKEKEIL